MMTRIRLILLAGVLCFFSLSAREKLIVGFECDRFPDSYTEGTEIKGIDVDLAREVARRKNFDLQALLLPRKELLSALDSGRINCVGNGVFTSEAKSKYATISYGEVHFVALVTAESPLRSAADLAGHAVAMESCSPAYHAYFAKCGMPAEGKLFETDTVESSLDWLHKDVVDFVVLSFDEAQEWSQNFPRRYRIIDDDAFCGEYSIFFRESDEKMRSSVKDALAEIDEDGTYSKISEKYAKASRPAPQSKASRQASAKLDLRILLRQLGGGLWVTVEIFFLTLLFSLPLGQIIALCRMAKNPLLSWVSRIYISVMRGTPLMLQLFVWYFGPYYLFKVNLSELTFCGIEYRFTAVIIGFSLNYAAYFAEIYRAGIESIPRGQYEAATVLGYTKGQTFFRIILPQVIKRVVPPVTNEVITLVKDTSLAFSLSVLEVFTIAKQVASAHATMMPFLVAGIFYYVFNFAVAFAMEKLEKALNYYH